MKNKQTSREITCGFAVIALTVLALVLFGLGFSTGYYTYGQMNSVIVTICLGGALLIESSRGSGAAVHVILPLAASGKAILHAPAKPDAQECARDFRIALSDALSDDDYYSENN